MEASPFKGFMEVEFIIRMIQLIPEIRSLSADFLPSRIKASVCGVSSSLLFGRSVANFFNPLRVSNSLKPIKESCLISRSGMIPFRTPFVDIIKLSKLIRCLERKTLALQGFSETLPLKSDTVHLLDMNTPSLHRLVL